MTTTHKQRADFIATMKRRSGADWARENADYEAAFLSVRNAIKAHRRRETLHSYAFAIAFAVALLCGIAVSLYRIEHEPKPWPEQVRAECEAEGKVAHEHRDERGRIVTLSCEAR